MMLLAVPVALAVLYGVRWIATLAAPQLLARANGGRPGASSRRGGGRRPDPRCRRRRSPCFPRPVAKAERIPPLVFYAPLAVNWLRLGLAYRSLSLPTAANPRITTGGMWGEAQERILRRGRRRSPAASSPPTLAIARPDGAGGGWIADDPGAARARRALPGRWC